ncbi:hypothetical protein [Streptomyces cyaneofuscatus]|uniref:hypothetical protein n=1 Tax=Streptomyces cyaneofuscatus TaxID=66883 RepID=UPI0036ECB808
MELFKVNVTPEQQAALQERLAEAFAPLTRAFAELNHAYMLGRSAERPGIIDTTAMATHHMGVAVEQLRTLNEVVVAQMRAENLAAADTLPH